MSIAMCLLVADDRAALFLADEVKEVDDLDRDVRVEVKTVKTSETAANAKDDRDVPRRPKRNSTLKWRIILALVSLPLRPPLRYNRPRHQLVATTST